MQKVNCNYCGAQVEGSELCEDCRHLFGLYAAMGRIAHGGLILSHVQHLLVHHTKDPKQEKAANFHFLEDLKDDAARDLIEINYLVVERKKEIEARRKETVLVHMLSTNLVQ